MKTILILGGHEGMPESMGNTIHICECILEDAKDGDEVEVTVKGTLVERDGKRFIAAETVDGEDVHDPEEMEDDHSMDSADALEKFMKNKKDNYAKA